MLSIAAAAASSMVIVNTVVIVRELLGFGQREVAWALAAYGGGSMLSAFMLPRLLDRIADRSVMLAASVMLTVLLASGSLVLSHVGADLWAALLVGWFLLGMAYSMSITPSGRLLRRSAGESDRPAIFAAQFALSHICWLIAYPVAGQVGAGWGQDVAFGILAALAAIGVIAAFSTWPANDPDALAHDHADLEKDHPHLQEHGAGSEHTHSYYIDDLHRQWPVR